jgi:hypothetical protein
MSPSKNKLKIVEYLELLYIEQIINNFLTIYFKNNILYINFFLNVKNDYINESGPWLKGVQYWDEHPQSTLCWVRYELAQLNNGPLC